MREQPRVLVVDDEESVVVTIKAILQLDGYDVATTTSGVKARALVRKVEYDLVLTDLRLEDGDGLDVLKAVRESYPETVTIMLTGYASLGRRSRRSGPERMTTSSSRARSRSFAPPSPAGSNAVGSGRAARACRRARRSQRIIAAAHRRGDGRAQQRYEQLKELDRMKSQFLSIASARAQDTDHRHVRIPPGRAAPGPPTEPGRCAGPGRRGAERRHGSARDRLPADGKLARLVDELLDVSRIQTGRIEFRYGDVDLSELASESRTRMQLTTTTHAISVRRDSRTFHGRSRSLEQC